jgi:hypothetical protein
MIEERAGVFWMETLELDEMSPPDEALDPVPRREEVFVPYGTLEDWTTTLVRTTDDVRTVIAAEVIAVAPVP